jgi:lipoic acid synthetase
MKEQDSGKDRIPVRLVEPGATAGKESGAAKMARNTAQFDPQAPRLRKPSWIRVRLPAGNAVAELKARLRGRDLVTVCEEASCPNIHECSPGTATNILEGMHRRCFFDVAQWPLAPDAAEPGNYTGARPCARIVITSVDRTPADGGAHFGSHECARRNHSDDPVPDRGGAVGTR